MHYSKPKFVFFDLGNVLLFFDHEIACNNLAQLCDQKSDAIRQTLFESDLQSRYEEGAISSREFYKAFCARLGQGVEVGMEQVCLAASSIFTPNYSIIPIVAHLKLTGVRLGILSNTCEAHWEYITKRRYGFINDIFDHFALSYELKSVKPSRLIYERACQQIGHLPEDIFFVDDLSDNVAAAKEFGIDAVQFHDSRQLTRELQLRGLPTAI